MLNNNCSVPHFAYLLQGQVGLILWSVKEVGGKLNGLTLYFAVCFHKGIFIKHSSHSRYALAFSMGILRPR